MGKEVKKTIENPSLGKKVKKTIENPLVSNSFALLMVFSPTQNRRGLLSREEASIEVASAWEPARISLGVALLAAAALWFTIVYYGLLWLITVYSALRWLTTVYCGLLWFTVVYCSSKGFVLAQLNRPTAVLAKTPGGDCGSVFF